MKSKNPIKTGWDFKKMSVWGINIVDLVKSSVEFPCKKNTIETIGYCPYHTNSHKIYFPPGWSFNF